MCQNGDCPIQTMNERLLTAVVRNQPVILSLRRRICAPKRNHTGSAIPPPSFLPVVSGNSSAAVTLDVSNEIPSAFLHSYLQGGSGHPANSPSSPQVVSGDLSSFLPQIETGENRNEEGHFNPTPWRLINVSGENSSSRFNLRVPEWLWGVSWEKLQLVLDRESVQFTFAGHQGTPRPGLRW